MITYFATALISPQGVDVLYLILFLFLAFINGAILGFLIANRRINRVYKSILDIINQEGHE